MSEDFDQYFRTTFQAELELLQEPGMWCQGWSWDRTAAWLLYNAKGNTDMARKPVAKKSNNEVATRLQEALKFLSVGYAASGDEQATHTWFEAGWGASFNGVVAAATPIEGLDLAAFPDTALLTNALSHVGKDLDLTVEDTGVHIVSGDYEAYVPVGDRSKTVPTAPDAAVADLPPNFMAALERCSRVTSDSAQTVRDAVIWSRPVAGQNYSQTLVATNGTVLVECELGGFIPANLCIPKAFYTALVKCGREPARWGFSATSFTAWFEDNSYIKTNLYDASAYPSSVGQQIEELMVADKMVPPPKGLFEAVAAVAPFGDGTVFFLGGHVSAGPDDEHEAWASKVAVDKLPDGIATNAKSLLLFSADAEKIYLGSNDDKAHRIVIHGPGYRAAIGGTRSVPAEATPSLVAPESGAGGVAQSPPWGAARPPALTGDGWSTAGEEDINY